VPSEPRLEGSVTVSSRSTRCRRHDTVSSSPLQIAESGPLSNQMDRSAAMPRLARGLPVLTGMSRSTGRVRNEQEGGVVIPLILWFLGVPLSLIIILWLIGVV